MPSTKWRNYCLTTLVTAAFALGDYTNFAYSICSRIDQSVKKTCYDQLTTAIMNASYKEHDQAVALCRRISEPIYQKSCIMAQ